MKSIHLLRCYWNKNELGSEILKLLIYHFIFQKFEIRRYMLENIILFLQALFLITFSFMNSCFYFMHHHEFYFMHSFWSLLVLICNLLEQKNPPPTNFSFKLLSIGRAFSSVPWSTVSFSPTNTSAIRQ